MPFAWTAIHLMNIINSTGMLEKDASDAEGGKLDAVAQLSGKMSLAFCLTKCFLLLFFLVMLIL